MKKIITLIILLAAGGTAFYLGWVQYSVPVGSYGVLRSKTHGTDSEIIREGKFRWVWYKLIPNNVTIAVFTIKENTIFLDFSGVLPSGDTYSTLAGLKTDFSYGFSGSLSYKLKAESLTALSERENLLSQAELDVYLSRLSKEIDNHVKALLWTYGENEKILKEAGETGTIDALEKSLAASYSDIEILSCTVNILRFPDFVLYNEVRQLYRDYLTAQRIDLRGTIGQIASENIENRRRIEELTGYGELLTKYPVLIQYLALERGISQKND
ncbi:MAG: hypothetical protein FWG07_06125 [Treponema sp.]|nr:hypothetical protein [Treponema sp.]